MFYLVPITNIITVYWYLIQHNSLNMIAKTVFICDVSIRSNFCLSCRKLIKRKSEYPFLFSLNAFFSANCDIAQKNGLHDHNLLFMLNMILYITHTSGWVVSENNLPDARSPQTTQSSTDRHSERTLSTLSFKSKGSLRTFRSKAWSIIFIVIMYWGFIKISS